MSKEKELGRNPTTGEANPIVFYKGEAHFSPWTVGTPLRVPGLVGTKVNSNADMRLIRLAVAAREGLANANQGKRWMEDRHLSPHHAGGDRVILLREGLHNPFKGGVQHTDLTH